jgi:hypothetical protein
MTIDIASMTRQAQTELDDLRTQIRARSEKIMTDTLAAFFAQHADVNTIYWAQWVPGFNDGDACTFQVGDINFTHCEAAEVDGPYFADEYEGPAHEFSAEAERDMSAVARFINSLGEHLEYAFDSNAFVRVTRDGVLVEEYDCGY